MGQAESLEKAAREKGYLEPDESIGEYTLAKSGLPVEKGLKGGSAMFSRYALLATDRNLHALKLGQFGVKSIKERVLEIPIAEAWVRFSGNQMKVGRRGEKPARWVFTTAPYGSRAKQLVSYVDSHG
jgi:hypothetical protein